MITRHLIFDYKVAGVDLSYCSYFNLFDQERRWFRYFVNQKLCVTCYVKWKNEFTQRRDCGAGVGLEKEPGRLEDCEEHGDGRFYMKAGKIGLKLGLLKR